ncbi:MAG: hypothetical protein A2201_11540 [Alicyclobacillus sp. RIFOXYA1_FULL_53_8]|nr:MAG: hypothetical protein A2201_11540 [Alicyclobacillus sp. RIFOXYA1_FULL_53_8]
MMAKVFDFPIYNAPTQEKMVALTFDIGWGKTVANPVLDILQRKRVAHATFFLAAPWVLKNPATARRIKRMGYEIGSHGYLHLPYSLHTNTWIEAQVKQAEQVIFQVIGIHTELIRTPYGNLNLRVVKKLHQMGYNVVKWRIDSWDWKNQGVRRIVNRVLTRVHPGDIILLHASDSAKQTAAALPYIIDGLRARGYRLVTVSTIIRRMQQPAPSARPT